MSAPRVRTSKRIFLGLALASTGCATHASPGRVLTRYLAAESEGRYDDAWALLDPRTPLPGRTAHTHVLFATLVVSGP